MQAKDIQSGSGDIDDAVNDLGPLAWVLDELRKSLDSAVKALKRFVRDAEAARGSDLATLDASQLRIARQQLHQAVGALEMVGLSGPALVLRAMETAVQKFVQQPELCSQDAAAKIENASFALTEFLQGVLAGKPLSAVSLFPQYRAVQELLRADRIHPADLWLNEWRWVEPVLKTSAEPRTYDAQARATFDQSVLHIMKGQANPAAGVLAELSLAFAARQDDHQSRIFWKIAAGYFEALAHELLPTDIYVRRASSRVLLQYASLSKGDVGISDRLTQDLLFFCAQAGSAPAAKAPALLAVRLAYGLVLSQGVDYTVVQFGRFDPALLAQARKRISAGKETWSSLSAGDVSKFKAVSDQFSLISDSLIKLHPSSEPLALALTRAVDMTVKSAQPPVIELAMEVATSMLYLEAAFEDLDPQDRQLSARTLHLSERLESVKNGGIAQPLESWMEELYRRVSDKQTMGSVVGELRMSLGELEKSLDIFFRNPNDKTVLTRVPDQLAQMRGVLSVLGLEQASHAVSRMRTSVEQMLDTEIDEERARAAGTFDQLGNNLGALSFLIDMLNYQPVLAKKLFVYDDVKGELRPLMGRTEKLSVVNAEPYRASDHFPAEVAMVNEVPSVSDKNLTLKLSALATHAALDGQPRLAQTAHQALLAVTSQDSAATALALDALALTAAPAVTLPVSQVEAADFDEDDLRDIFLDEAREVSANGLEAVNSLKTNPSDINQLTVLRRVFHTLKGSARMVGLNEFGEAGWAMEQLFNGWLADQKPANDDLLHLSGQSLAALSRWIQDIADDCDTSWSAATFRTSAQALRLDGRFVALTIPTLEVNQAFAAPVVSNDPATSPDHHNFALQSFVEPLSTQSLPDLDADFDVASQNQEQTVPAPLEDMVVNVEPVGDMLDMAGIDLHSLSKLSGVPAALTSVDSGFKPEPLPELTPEIDSAAAEMLEIEALQQQLDSYEMQAADSAHAAAEGSGDSDLIDLSAEDFDAKFLMSAEVAPPAQALNIPVPHFDHPVSVDEQTKIIGDLHISIPLYNVFLNEADEWSRRLVAELSEWAMERRHTIDDSTVSFAHSLAGSSATVGFSSLSEIARALENAMLHSQAHFSAKTTVHYSDLFVAAAEDIRRLLHQFAAGFLKDADGALIFKLNTFDFSVLEIEAAAAGSNGSADMQVSSDPIDVIDFADLELPAEKTEEKHFSAAVISEDLGSTGVVAASAESASASTLIEAAAVQTVLSSGVAPVMLPPVQFVAATAFVPVPTAQLRPIFAAPAIDKVDSSNNDIDAIDAIDAELFPIFDEEAAELMPQLGGALRQWSARPDNLSARSEVLRTLHTLKGSARLAGALRLGEMAHRIESEIEFLGTDAAASQDFEPLLTRYDAMQLTLDVLRTGGATAEQSSVASYDVPAVPTVAAIKAQDSERVIAHIGSERASDKQAIQTQLLKTDGLNPDVAASVPAQAAPGKVLIPAPQTMSMQPIRQAATASIRVRAQLLDRMVNQAGEVMMTRSRLEVELGQLRGSLGDMTDNLNRLRQQLRDIELQAETQMQSRLAQAKELQAGFDPLEFDRFTRVQELTRMMAESVNDVATVQRTLQRTVEATEDDLVAQARQTRELQRDLLKTRMVEFEGISDRLYRVVRQASKDSGKQVKLDLLGGTIEMDRGMLDRMTPAFEHLLRNCVAHGIESPAVRSAAGKDAAGLITVHLRQEGNDVSVEFSDDGAGLNLQRIHEKAVSSGLIAADQVIDEQQAAELIFMPGFTTATEVTELSGRGIGMDVVRSEINSVGGRIETTFKAGKGTQFKLVLPLTTAVTQVVMLRSGALTIGVPSNVVEVVRRTSAKDIQQAYNTGSLDVAGEPVPFFWSGALLQSTRQSTETQGKTTSVVIFKSAAQRIALHVDEVLGNQEVVVKNLGPQLSRLPGLAGMSVLASGAVVLIYNPVALAAVYGVQARALSADSAEPHMLESMAAGTNYSPVPGTVVPQIPLVMVVDDSVTVRRVTQRLLQREGYRVVLAADGLQALERLQEERPSVVLSDIEMPRMDGFDLARNIRADAQLKNIPIIMITSRIAEKHRIYAKELGVDHYLGKPYPEDELMGLVKHYCSAEVLP